MPISRVDKKTGAISFSSTAEENSILKLQEENKDLLTRVEALEKLVLNQKPNKSKGK